MLITLKNFMAKFRTLNFLLAAVALETNSSNFNSNASSNLSTTTNNNPAATSTDNTLENAATDNNPATTSPDTILETTAADTNLETIATNNTLDVNGLIDRLNNISLGINPPSGHLSASGNFAPYNTPNNEFINGPLDQFNVTELVGLKFEILGKFYLAITNISLYFALVLAVIIAIFYFGDNDSKLVPNKWSIVLETFFASLKGMVKDQIGLAYEVYLPFIFSIFFFYLTGNLISNIPYSFATNASAIASIGFSLTFVLAVTIGSLFAHREKFFRHFIPDGTPLALVPLLVSIEFTSYVARGFSLGVRMFSNLFSGHCLLAILSVFGKQLLGATWESACLTLILALPIFLALIGLEVAVSFIQAFVLSLLSCNYIKDSVLQH